MTVRGFILCIVDLINPCYTNQYINIPISAAKSAFLITPLALDL
jgi:hypothetical protein